MKKTENTPFPAPQGGDLEALIRAMEGVPVLVAGDVMLDRFVYGHVERISPESPVPVLSVSREEAMPGGAGNTLANLKGLGAKGMILSVAGEDEDGKTLRRMIREMGCDDSGLLSDGARPTIVKTRYLAGHQQLLRTDHETKLPVSDKVAGELLKRAEGLMKKARALVLSDYGKGLLRRDIIAALIAMAKKENIPVIVDPKGRDFSLYAGADIITPNRKELSGAARGAATETDEDIVRAAKEIIAGCNIGAVIATRSKDGVSVVRKTGEPVHLRGAKDIEVFDVSGAGDSVIATVSAALAAGGKLEQAAELANIAGSIVVTKVGTAPIRGNELIDAVRNDEGVFAYADKKAPLAEWDESAEQLRRWRAKGLKIGFTNGCFDILHAGHVSYLNAARGQCDRLVVGLNRDDSVRLLKGEDRPVHDENARAAVLAALACVDMVVLFGAEKKNDDNTAIELVSLLKPDLYFKGGDYTLDQIPEAAAVAAGGGRVAIMAAVEGQSTTRSIKKIRTEAA
ncbi:MAG: D-glycero-beta-D-manno-heptose-7-phosphate kinase [Alphaproteobacteria bacterium]